MRGLGGQDFSPGSQYGLSGKQNVVLLMIYKLACKVSPWLETNLITKPKPASNLVFLFGREIQVGRGDLFWETSGRFQNRFYG